MNNNIKFKNGNIKQLQKYIAQKIKNRGFLDENLHERLLLLTEELGELVKACRKISGMNIDQKREIKTKLAKKLPTYLICYLLLELN